MLIRIDKDASVPVYLQIANEIKLQLLANRLKDGDEMPPIRIIADMLEVNLHTVRHAYAVLAKQGILSMGLGRRTRICMKRSTPAPDAARLFEGQLNTLLFDAYWSGVSLEQLKKTLDWTIRKMEVQNG